MSVYFLTFAISIFFMKFSNSIKNKYVRDSMIIISLLFPCMIAGLRASNVGTDVHVYVKPLYNLATEATSFFKYYKMSWFDLRHHQLFVKEYEIMFLMLVYVSNKIFNNFQVLLFFIEVLMIVPLFLGIRNYKELRGKEWICLSVFLFMLFNTSLNAMRQFVGISIAFWGASEYINNRKILKTRSINSYRMLIS